MPVRIVTQIARVSDVSMVMYSAGDVRRHDGQCIADADDGRSRLLAMRAV
jgi:hypothetical protein